MNNKLLSIIFQVRRAAKESEAVSAAVQEMPRRVAAAFDAVDALNPYGCNQYGEGWAHPHNGNSTAYRNMSPFSPNAPKRKVLTNETDRNTIDQVTDRKRVRKSDYPNAEGDALKKEADKEKQKDDERKKKEESGKSSGKDYSLTDDKAEELTQKVAGLYDEWAKGKPTKPDDAKRPMRDDYRTYSSYEKAMKEYYAKIGEYKKQYAEWKEKEPVKEALKMLELPPEDRKAFDVDASSSVKGWGKEKNKEISEQLANLSRFVNPDKVIQVKINSAGHDTRCYYYPGDKTVYIHKKKTGTTSVPHEVVHAMEDRFPEMNGRTIDFMLKRAEKDGFKSDSLRRLTGSAYRAGEVAFVDDFVSRGSDAYCGKVYLKDRKTRLFELARMSPEERKSAISTTDLLTMGTERLIKSPVEFAKEDPEYFKFVIQTLRA